MNTKTSVAPAKGPAPAPGRPVWLQALWVLPVLLLFVAAPFLAAGTLAWPAGWVYVCIVVVGALVSRVLMGRANPGLAAERARFTSNEGTKTFDKTIVPLLAVGPVAIVVVAGLDFRFGWPPAISLAAQVAGLALTLAAYVVTTWAMVANRFFSAVVRIQADRGHQVVKDGPYRIVRHPGYAGSIAGIVGIPIMLGSLWALIPAALILVLYVVRTGLEDTTLQAELPGYKSYAREVRYRLLPGVW